VLDRHSGDRHQGQQHVRESEHPAYLVMPLDADGRGLIWQAGK